MLEKNIPERRLHYAVAVIGGFFGGFAIIMHHDMLASAQTANLISLTIAILGRKPLEIALHLGSLVVYFLSLALTVVIRKLTKINIEVLSIIIDIISLVIIALIPPTVDDFVALYPIFFAVAFQWVAFTEVDGYNSSTIFSTNNFRQFTTSSVEYLFDKNKKHLHKASLYGGTILFFHIGVAISFVACNMFSYYSSFVGIIATLPAIFFEINKIEKKENKKMLQRVA